ncbi:Aerobic-type carbon monoxide dehydrogenase large subunit CoxL/CutL-like protein [Rubrobacter radiotolerans]|uniref:Aerobic-type carbon monoxide dehydrogenase large subunit CoxL/CutL-like protein n=1 Tax=Rubrobacter radiotolerans TaxID=42256 RepID=A0A023X3C1_RUBRA|nr:xanthine dehydrogenase family protein molybdopterin-binding subunit [Rubrobacter radiotolerans]AHY46972.1 Aerobic-type carbon monoxide dehydrogenase large subunit CoxL/CutL-like protein [Rubrobacter radiotolerans]MDX5894378.1 xanthine dehydrogenase family protein molybdopterin-binding subunit [Rubrobacter radiotolerans]SMC05863.1 xanthine dehydrogenase YagR molybdenum-binding subunit [Rubrobacter radiotolerans DSM 5868]
MTVETRNAVGAPLSRLDGPEKARGAARYAYEHPADEPLYLFAVQSTVASGRVKRIDTSVAEAEPGVVVVMTHENAPKLEDIGDAELAVLQSDRVGFRGQFVAGVIADSFETARYAASLVRVEYEEREHDADFRPDRSDLYAPEKLNAGFETDTDKGDLDAGLAGAEFTVNEVYTTPREHNNPMEPHATTALWSGGALTLHDSTQGVFWTQKALAPLFGLDRSQVRVVAPHVGGGFGSKGLPHANVVLVSLAARLVEGRAVKFALTRRQMFAVAGYRTPTVQRLRLGADAQGRLTAVGVEVTEQTSRIKEFAEQTGTAARMMYACKNIRTAHRLAALDVAVPSWMRAPGEAPGMFALEAAMDELAERAGLDPVELRIVNEPDVDPETDLPFSSRNLVACLREGARRFGWERRNPEPRSVRDGEWLVGYGVASSVYPVYRMGGSVAKVSAALDESGEARYAVEIGAADLGTGTWTALTQISADALGVEPRRVEVKIGDTELPNASGAGGSAGINSWGSAIVEAAGKFRETLEAEHGGTVPEEGLEVSAKMPRNPHQGEYSMYAFGAQFAEVRVNEFTGEVRVPRLLGHFAAGRIVNPRTARSQLVGGMVMGLSMALHEESVLDPRFGHVVNGDLAEYHIPVNADIGEVEVGWVEEDDPYVNPLGTKGIGELGIVGTAAAVTSAVYNATGRRVRDLPVKPDKLL